MVYVVPTGIYLTIFGLVCSIIAAMLNLRLLMKLYRLEAFRNQHEYRLFAYRFCADFCSTVVVSIYFFSMCLLFTKTSIFDEYYPLFYVALLCSNLSTGRGIIALCIATERVIAAFLPIKFYKYRSHFPSVIVAISATLFGGFEDVVLYYFCDFVYIEKPECSAFGCALNTCFLKYWEVNKSIIAVITALFSLLIFIKIIKIRFCSGQQSADLARANYLCLADTLTVLVFDFMPYIFAITMGDQMIYLKGYGPYNAVLKVVACLLDSIIATFLIGKIVKAERKTHEIQQYVADKKMSEQTNVMIHISDH